MKSCTLKQLVSFIWKFLRLQPWGFFFIFALSITWAIDTSIWPYLLRLIIDTLTRYDTDRLAAWDTLKWLLLAGAFFLVAVETAFRSRDWLRARSFPKIEAEVRMAMFDHIQHHSPKYFNDHFAGSLSNKISDMTTQLDSLFQSIMIFIPAIAGSILTLLFFFPINPIFTAVLAVWIVLHLAICLFYSSICVKYADEHGEARSALMGKILDSFTNNFAVNLFIRFKYEKSRIATYQQVEKEKNTKALKTVFYMLVMLTLLFLIGMFTVGFFLTYFWTRNQITTGEVVQVFNTTFNLIMIIWVAGEQLPHFYKSLGICRQALTVMQDPPDVVDPPHTPPLIVKKGEIIFDNVSFQYGHKKLFANKNVHIRGGEKVGLVGFSGAGKSTFVNLILRFYPVESGRILIDGQDIATITLGSLRKQIALIPQDPLLFHRTLKENIQYGRIEATNEEIVEAAKMAHCNEFITKCVDGYSTLVGERGTKLSGGERQRIAIARAILAEAPILILDEATSSLDSVTEKYIQESLEELMHNKTTIVIAHRLSTLSKMDRILVFNHGKIIEEGSHQELLNLQGRYAFMWRMQSGGFLPDEPED